MKLCRFIFALLIASVAVVPQRALAALNAAIVFEVRTTGSDTNGGGFKTGATGTDWSQQNAAQYSVTDGVTAGTTTITSATANFGTDVVGNLIYVQGGTGSVTAGWYEITVRTNSTTITVDRSTGLTAGTGVTLKIGGALASPGQAAAAKVAGNDVWIKAGTYSATSASTNIPGGMVSDSTGGASATNWSFWRGYNTARWSTATGPTASDLANKPLLQASGAISSFTMFTVGALGCIDNLAFDGASKTSSRCITVSTSSANAIRCKASNATNGGVVVSGVNAFARFCEATGCTSVDAITITDGTLVYCVSHDNTGVAGIALTASGAQGSAVGCISYANATGFKSNSRQTLVSCTAHGNSSDGFLWAGSSSAALNCISYGNSGYGYNTSSSNEQAALYSCASGTNTSGRSNNIGTDENAITLSGDPFVNAASGNFALDSTTGEGAACRAAGIPGAFPGATTTGYLDVGAVQHQDSGGTGGGPLIRSSGARISP
jgi:hypothetical protein